MLYIHTYGRAEEFRDSEGEESWIFSARVGIHKSWILAAVNLLGT